jgi:hypothetical protein
MYFSVPRTIVPNTCETSLLLQAMHHHRRGQRSDSMRLNQTLKVASTYIGGRSEAELSPNVCHRKFKDDLGSLFAMIRTSIMSGQPVEVLLYLVLENIKKR